MHAISYFIENVALHTTLVLRVQEDWLLKNTPENNPYNNICSNLKLLSQLAS